MVKVSLVIYHILLIALAAGKSEAVFSVQIERRNRNVSEAMADYSIIARNRHLQSGIPAYSQES